MMDQYIQESPDFFKVSKEIAGRFIQSVVAVDDQMIFDRRPAAESANEDVIAPDDDGFGITSDDEISSDGAQENEHLLHYQDLSSAFASKGIVCSGFKPDLATENAAESIFLSSKNADITILDWQMEKGGDKGDLAIQSILGILNQDKNEGGRLRLITVYTAEDKEEVLDVLVSRLKSDRFNCDKSTNSDIKFDHNELKFCKIEVISKEVTEVELSESVITSFTQLTAGLLSNAALSAISDIRDKTHNILYKFNKSLDPAYLSHVLGLISSPSMREQAHEVAFDYAVELISDEIKSELQISIGVKESLSRDSLSYWPSYINNKDEDYFGLKIGKNNVVKFGCERMSSFLTVTNNEDLLEVLKIQPSLLKAGDPDINDSDAIRSFARESIQLSANGDSIEQHLELSALECIRRDNNTNVLKKPTLKQGTILRDMKSSKYFICIQPLCDSVRLTEDTGFTFLRVSKVKPTKPFSHVIRGQDGHIRLCVDPSSKRLNIFKFSPHKETRVIEAEGDQGEFTFRDVDSSKEYEWCGELKQSVSQSIANAVAAQMSRVGLDSFEWLRLKGA